jgi:putative RecB family exonuclease
MAWRSYKEVKVEPSEETPTKPRYSLTSDILGYRLCPRQYGFFNVRGYVPARTVQFFYGTIIHGVLDRCHHHYQGREDVSTKGTLPNDDDIDTYFGEVEVSLRARGITAINRGLVTQAKEVLKKFNRIEGPGLYPRVIDTEHRVQSDREQYIVEGVVDVLLDASGGVEIWDYKGSKKPDRKNKSLLESYEYQMRVYAWLYHKRNKEYPKKAILYFMNELRDKVVISRPPNALYEVDISPESIIKALEEFDQTAQEIQGSKDSDTWFAPSNTKPIADTCTICDIRWSCPSIISERTPSIS